MQATRDDVLAAVEALLRAGLAGDWNEGAARDLAGVIDGRDDVGYEDVQEITAEVIKAEQPKQGLVKELMTKIAVGGFGGALATLGWGPPSARRQQIVSSHETLGASHRCPDQPERAKRIHERG